MDAMIQFVFLVIATNAGGEGKTMLAHLMQALWQLAAEPVGMVDADAGNHAAKVAEGDGNNVKTLGWGVHKGTASQIFETMHEGHVILDLGANTYASQAEIVALIPELRRAFAAGGFRTVALLPVSTNKIGAVEAVVELETKLDGFETLFVTVDRDQSGAFDAGLPVDKTVSLGHLQPGFQRFHRDVGGMMPTLISPPADHILASDYLAEWMLNFAVQNAVADIIGPRAVSAIRHRMPRKMPPLGFKVATVAHTTDAALVATQRRSAILAAISRAGWTATGLRSVAGAIDAGAL